MEYPKDFIDRLKAAWPDEPKYHRLAEEGYVALDECLHVDKLNFPLTPEEVVRLIDEGNVQAIRDAAQRAIERKRLARECWRLRVDAGHGVRQEVLPGWGS